MSIDTTEKVLADRRFDTARELVEEIAFAQNRRKLFETLADVLERNSMDIPFAMCYSISDERSSYPNVDLTLEAAIGIPDDHPCCPYKMQVPLPARRRPMAAPMQDLRPDLLHGSPSPSISSRRMSSRSMTSSGGTMRGQSYIVSEDRTAWPIAQALQVRQCVVMDDCSELIEGLPLRQWDMLPDQAIVVPIMNNHTSPSAVLILGLNVHSTLDQAYLDWIHVLRGHLASAIASVTAFETQVSQRLEREKLERAKTAWFRGAAHEFRTPLTLIAGPLEDVLSTPLDGEQRNTIKLAQRNVQRLQRLVTSLLDFTRIEAGRLTAHFAPGDFGQFVENIASLFKPALDRKGIEFLLDIQESSDLVSFDPVLFEMVLSNVLSNSFKYTATGSVTLKVWFDSNVNLSVVDTGIGVGEDEEVGKLYHRTQTAVQSGVGGTGIGLALAKEIVKLHEGELSISQNADGIGTHVLIWFPKDHLETEDYFSVAPIGAYVRQTASEMVLSTIGEEVGSEWSGDTGRDSTSSIGTPLTMGSSQSISGTSSVAAQALGEALMFEKSDILLVVDDNEELRTYISHIFSPFCTVIQASGGDEAYKLVKSHRPHLVLSDLLMPASSGMDLLLAIRSSEDRGIKSTPVIILSAINDDETRLEGLVGGAEEYISKPFKRNELLARVHLHMQMGKRRAALEDLFAQREQEIAVLSDHCPSGIIRADADGRIVYANAAFCEPAGITANDITRDTDLLALWSKCCDADMVELMGDKWAAIFDGEAATTNVTWKWKTGRTMTANFIRLDQVRPNMSGIIGCVTDITYQEERLQEAEQRRIAAEEQKRSHERLVDFTSHEIRTPVSAILQCSSIVKENLLSLQEQLQEDGTIRSSPALLAQVNEDLAALDSIHQCGLVQERIAADVLSLARIQLDMLSLHSVPVDIAEAGQSALNLFKAEAKMKRINMALEFGDTLRETGVHAVNTDPVRLGQVITNLISNAIRFTSTSTVRDITVAFNVAWAPPTTNCLLPPEAVYPQNCPPGTPVYLYVAVRDTGPGMTPEERDGLFQRFHQGNKMIHTQYGGSGLGLFICKNITELLGGRIEVESAVGRGSEFRFFIQTETASMPPPKVVETEIKQLQHIQKMNVLVVEDNDINSTVLRRQILKAGLDCDVADNGLVALNHLLAVQDLPPLTPGSEASINLEPPLSPVGSAGSAQRQPYDVVLMDLEMPVMDGLTAVRRIRQFEAEGKLPGHQLVIALTGNAREGQIEEALKSGMDDVVIKPYKLPQLLRTMEQAVMGQSLGDLRLN
ncbi:two-component-like hybrid sensor histidine kinase 2 [Trichosporon asahii var. asahii CBS 8904]|uniref:histidine kinase n=2 Tax=Trichosporon asahii var. asahii TaxID=189963 RepID=K1VJU5_TRIAC|nr:two-component-like hybrid sensor histidine kinase 2 [Trichosporon asahii var. asahii CBS 2479]EJT48035.1 two-component-like hybrid sensor histidine kinase 2 [Trichosporon asahii var. asahii CBS 2479]EKC99461.1 two-component-like hybrid sensor histidine kinase 2 [Trichosporon asahii var. asahii CBS 8904]